MNLVQSLWLDNKGTDGHEFPGIRIILLKRTADMVGLEHPVFQYKFDLESSQQDGAYAQVALS